MSFKPDVLDFFSPVTTLEDLHEVGPAGFAVCDFSYRDGNLVVIAGRVSDEPEINVDLDIGVDEKEDKVTLGMVLKEVAEVALAKDEEFLNKLADESVYITTAESKKLVINLPDHKFADAGDIDLFECYSLAPEGAKGQYIVDAIYQEIEDMKAADAQLRCGQYRWTIGDVTVVNGMLTLTPAVVDKFLSVPLVYSNFTKLHNKSKGLIEHLVESTLGRILPKNSIMIVVKFELDGSTLMADCSFSLQGETKWDPFATVVKSRNPRFVGWSDVDIYKGIDETMFLEPISSLISEKTHQIVITRVNDYYIGVVAAADQIDAKKSLADWVKPMGMSELSILKDFCTLHHWFPMCVSDTATKVLDTIVTKEVPIKRNAIEDPAQLITHVMALPSVSFLGMIEYRSVAKSATHYRTTAELLDKYLNNK